MTVCDTAINSNASYLYNCDYGMDGESDILVSDPLFLGAEHSYNYVKSVLSETSFQSSNRAKVFSHSSFTPL
jgi:hypothetical protein